jgi:hypothetical protein
MKNYLTQCALGMVLGTVTAFAGSDMPRDYSKELHKSVLTEECYYKEKEFNIGVFGLAGIVTGQGPTNSGFGGGVEAGYFFTKWIGFSLQGYGWDSSDAIYGMSGSVIFRYPIENCQLAPYVFGGVGYDAEPQEQGTAHGGAGLEYRFTPQWGVFADGRYVAAWDTNDYVQVRTGVRFAF